MPAVIRRADAAPLKRYIERERPFASDVDGKD